MRTLVARKVYKKIHDVKDRCMASLTASATECLKQKILRSCHSAGQEHIRKHIENVRVWSFCLLDRNSGCSFRINIQLCGCETFLIHTYSTADEGVYLSFVIQYILKFQF